MNIYPPFYAEITWIQVRKIDRRRHVRYTVSRHILALLLLLPSHKIPLESPQQLEPGPVTSSGLRYSLHTGL